jgi:hypothetical protein
MVRALLDGTKTQARRVVKFRNHETENMDHGFGPSCPYGQPGDRLWVRESGVRLLLAGNGEQRGLFRHDVPETPEVGRYWVERTRAPGASYSVAGCTRESALLSLGAKATPSIHMPRWASRILLEITGVCVERLQDISEADALAEGIKELNGRFTFNDGMHESRTAVDSYRALWESINGAGSWDANPFVWVVEFKRVPL